jgi:hypothetical protein
MASLGGALNFRLLFFIAAFLAAPSALSASFIITPIFGTSITSDPNAAAIEAVINTAVNFYEATFSNNMDVDIDYDLMTSGLGESSFQLYAVGYAAYRQALVNDASGANDAIALANLPNTTANPVTGTNYINIKPATEAAVGLISSSPSSPVQGGTVSLNVSLTTTGGENAAGQEATGSYSLLATVEHETDEILGLGSTLGLGLSSSPTSFSNGFAASGGNPSPQDLFRYNSSGQRSFTPTDTPNIFFSINGTTDLVQFDNQNDGGDYGDWQSDPLPNGVSPQVQDAFATPNSSPFLTDSSVEITDLDVIGYTTVAPEPSTTILLSAVAPLVWLLRRKRISRA